VHYDPYWEQEHVAYLPQIPAKWLDTEDLRGWMVFSGDYGHYDGKPTEEESYYGFMMRPFRLMVIEQ
jgi:hypothetical protein